jgi:hypothetical protein
MSHTSALRTIGMIGGIGLGVVAAVGFAAGSAAAAGEVYWYDTNADGVDDAIGIDANGDGRTDVEAHDTNQDGRCELLILDPGFDGYFEVAAHDVDGDGVVDDVQIDSDLDGFLDVTFAADPRLVEFNSTVWTVGAPSTPGFLVTLMNTMTSFTGQAVWSSDTDHDGTVDGMDASPLDPYVA